MAAGAGENLSDRVAAAVKTLPMIDAARHFAGRLLGGRSASAEAKSAGVLAALAQLGGPVWGGLSAEAIIRDAYVGNIIAHKAVRIVTEGAASLPCETPVKRAADLLAQPNPELSYEQFMEMAYIHLLISGNAYIESVALDGDNAPRALYLLRPDRVRVIADARGWVEGWAYRAGGTERVILRGHGASPLLHLKLPHPGDDAYGLSPLAAARKSIDLYNKSADWAKALLDNSARPSGALVYGKDGAFMTPDQFDRLKHELETAHSGSRNAGRPLLLEGGLDWKPMSLSPAELDFMSVRNAAAREIALSVGVPPMLLGIPGDNTYSNYKEANKSLWRETIVPMVERTLRDIAGWLAQHYEEPVPVRIDLDAVTALSEERERLWRRVGGADFLTNAEKREILGLKPESEAS